MWGEMQRGRVCSEYAGVACWRCYLIDLNFNPSPPLPSSACRTAWYCGTACSHADWREGGHRRTCKRLAAERAARKAALEA